MNKPKLDIARNLSAVDKKNYDFYDDLSEEEKKLFSPYILMRYTSNVQGNRDLQEWFIQQTNEAVNKHHWILSKNHKSLLWKLFATIGVGSPYYHQYLAAGKKEKINKIEKLIAEIFPAMKLEDIKIMADLMSEKDKKELLDKMGFDNKQRKEYE